MPETILNISDARILDGSGSDVGGFTCEIRLSGDFAENTPPTGGEDFFVTTEDEAITFDVLANDFDLDGDDVSVTDVFVPTHGTALLEADDSITYTPNLGFVGSDHVSYVLSDGVDHVLVDVNIVVEPAVPNDTPADHQFIADLRAAPEGMPGPMHPDRMAEHMASMALVNRANLTHAAVRDGDWFDRDTWFQGRIPGDDARFVIPEGIRVVYNGEDSARIFWGRVSGELYASRDIGHKMICGTLISDHNGTIDFGTTDDPVLVKSEWVIADFGDISLDYDPTLLSRCLMTHGRTRMHGITKKRWTVAAIDPLAGDTELVIQDFPDNWSEGDKILVMGTRKMGFKNYKRPSDGKTVTDNMDMDSEDEVVEITGINGNTISIDPPLQFDHTRPIDKRTGEAFQDYAAIGNLTSNVLIRSENPDLSHRRGHTMFMHNPDVDVRHTEFADLGRTDKRFPSRNVNDIIADPNATLTPQSNIQTRYKVHFHFTGLSVQAYLIGCSLHDGWGWGAVNHQSNVIMDGNVSYKIWGCHFVGEDGNELGCISKSMIVKAGGHKIGHTGTKGIGGGTRDIWRNGEGIGISGRMLRVMDNVIANTGHGISWNVREAVADNAVDDLDVPATGYGQETINQRETNIQCAARNVFWCMERAYIVIKRGANQLHDHLSWFEVARAYRVSAFADWTYTSKYLFDRILAVGSDAENPYRTGIPKKGYGMDMGTNSFSLITVNSHFQDFDAGIYYGGRFTNDRMTPEDWDIKTINTTFENCGVDHLNFEVEGMLTITDGVTKGDPISFEFEETPVIRWNQALNMQGTITDSLGPRKRILATDGDGSRGTWGLSVARNIVPMMQEQGIMRDGGGNLWFDFRDPLADHFDNEESILVYRLPLEGFTDERIADAGIPVRDI